MSEIQRALFGTDGVRGLANQRPMTAEDALRLGRAIGYRLRQVHGRRPKIIIGKDTRLSGYMIEAALSSGLLSVGAEVYLIGPLPTPGIAFLTEGMRADAGLVISASHNPFEDNGIKVFGPDGYKLPDAEEARLEAIFFSDDLDDFRPTGTGLGRAHRIDDALGRYSVFAKMAFPRHLTLEGLKVVIDCANGAAYKIAPEVLRELGAEVIARGVSPNGTNINQAAGALYPEVLAQTVRDTHAHIGIALDGDADRCILVDERGDLVDGDQILAIIGRDMAAKGRLEKNTVVATVMSNMGLERALGGVGVQVVRVGVGDRYVVERMREGGFNVGGEQSGHVILREHTTTGDGLITALAVLGIQVETQRPLSELAACMQRFPQVLKNLNVARKPPIEALPKVAAAIRALEDKLHGEGRVFVRYSGTQDLARVMIEGPDLDTITAEAEEIVALLSAEIGV
ncbi:phosphoglucosamine mutase [Myxococcota bacterium]|nr:phosphoglucosamine mutase [Myxococcota bacterium]MBU1433108.1 phosphoglucosamine mutase [Myxococcota bacterium]MBU1900259.1 phosphoglucosamine mutase [Myxococcota bacterium]